MDIMYGVLQHKDITMDLSQSQSQDTRCTLALTPTDRVAMESLAVDDKQFTAEHILQLCKFLAEKSKRNKNLHQQQQSPRKLKPSNQSPQSAGVRRAEITAEMISAPASTESRRQSSTPATTATTTSHILTDKAQAPAANANTCMQPANNTTTFGAAATTVTATATATASCSLQYSVGKRDILLKIRRQIFERKRQRQLAHVQQPSDVWRPW